MSNFYHAIGPNVRHTQCRNSNDVINTLMLFSPQHARKVTYKEPSLNTVAASSWATTHRPYHLRVWKNVWNSAGTTSSAAPWSMTPTNPSATHRRKQNWMSLLATGTLGIRNTAITRKCAHEIDVSFAPLYDPHND